MYAFGIPAGMMVDAKGPRWGMALGILLFGAGYYPIAKGTVHGVARPGDYDAWLTRLQRTRLAQDSTAYR